METGVKMRLDIRVREDIGSALLQVRERVEAPSMSEMVEAIIEDWLKQRKLLV